MVEIIKKEKRIYKRNGRYFFVMNFEQKLYISAIKETENEFFIKTKLPQHKKVRSSNFWEFDDKMSALMFADRFRAHFNVQ